MKMLVLFFLVLSLPSPTLSQEHGASPCESAGFSQFDFWLGSWEARWRDADGTSAEGTNVVSRILGGCVIHESFNAPSLGFEGWSVSVYDSSSDMWRQTWVDNSGGYLDFTGSFTDGIMDLRRIAERNGKRLIQRMVWYNITSDRFDWNWESSDNDGVSWKVNWKIQYSRSE